MNKCRYNDGIHVVRKTENGNYILLYCENCSKNVRWIDKNYPAIESKRFIGSSGYIRSNG